MTLLILFLIGLLTSSKDKPVIVYVGDPMCSWCYGIAPELEAVEKHFGQRVDWELIMGGLRPYNTQSMTDLKGFLTEHWKEVHEASGQPFSYDILDRSDLKYDTEPACRAVMVVREMAPEKTLLFMRKAQTRFYSDNKYLGNPDSYKNILESLDLDFNKFKTEFLSDKAKARIQSDFAKANELGAHAFPTVFLKIGEKYQTINRGFMTSDQMIKKIEKLIN